MSRWGVAPIDDEGRFLRSGLKLFSPPEPSRLIEAILGGESIPFTSAVLYKRSFIQSELWDAKAATIDDFDWFCRVAMRGGIVSRVDAISYFWRQHSRSVQIQEKLAGTLFHRFMTIRYDVYRKIEESLVCSNALTAGRKKLLARTYYKFLTFLAQSGSPQWRELLEKIYRLDPEFVVDQEREPDPRIRGLVRAFGLPSFLAAYGFLKRIGSPSASAATPSGHLELRLPIGDEVGLPGATDRAGPGFR